MGSKSSAQLWLRDAPCGVGNSMTPSPAGHSQRILLVVMTHHCQLRTQHTPNSVDNSPSVVYMHLGVSAVDCAKAASATWLASRHRAHMHMPLLVCIKGPMGALAVTQTHGMCEHSPICVICMHMTI